VQGIPWWLIRKWPRCSAGCSPLLAGTGTIVPASGLAPAQRRLLPVPWGRAPWWRIRERPRCSADRSPPPHRLAGESIADHSHSVPSSGLSSPPTGNRIARSAPDVEPSDDDAVTLRQGGASTLVRARPGSGAAGACRPGSSAAALSMPPSDHGRPRAVAAQGGAYPPPATERRPVPGRQAPAAPPPRPLRVLHSRPAGAISPLTTGPSARHRPPRSHHHPAPYHGGCRPSPLPSSLRHPAAPRPTPLPAARTPHPPPPPPPPSPRPAAAPPRPRAAPLPRPTRPAAPPTPGGS
jgi:hypothetical protein